MVQNVDWTNTRSRTEDKRTRQKKKMASVESRLKLVEQEEFKGAFTDDEFASYRNLFLVPPPQNSSLFSFPLLLFRSF